MINKNKHLLFPLRGVGPQTVKHLARLNIFTIQDLLLHLPIRYQDRTRIQSIHYLLPETEAVIEGIVQSVTKPPRGRTKLLCELKDATGRIRLRFFHLMPYQAKLLTPGARLRCYSEVRCGPQGDLEMVHPEIHVISDEKLAPIEQHLTPIYPATEGLTQYTLRKLTQHALAIVEEQKLFAELLPQSLLQTLSFPTLAAALQFIHRPPQAAAMPLLVDSQTPAHKRLIFEELLSHRISLLQMKTTFQNQSAAALPNTQLVREFLSMLPFQLTSAQQRVTEEITADLMRPFPMLRLVQGDVGSGKTVVAALAMLQAVSSGCQAAMMAPTDLLAEQHYRVFKRWLAPLNIQVIFLSSHIKGRARTAVLASIANGEAHIILGTHALFQQNVVFSNLALVVIDEQHRFGVEQRALFREKGMQANYYPHQLIMTATPIPRTLAMSFYADLDSSVIDELPPGRTPITTSVLANTRRDEVMQRIRQACQQGRQAYWVCPLIEESEALNCQAAIKTAEQLQAYFAELKIGLVHGRMKSAEKEAVMAAFQQGDIHLLVATTVIEVGVDVPNASVMIIENAERLGLSQLHQLRGRVGRGTAASYCILLYQHPLSALAKQRLAVMRETVDGFQIAQRDLELRGPGDVLGTRQTGALSFRVADLMRDSHLLADVHQAAEVIMREHPGIIGPLIDRWIANSDEYRNV